MIPVEKNKNYQLEILDYSFEGQGVAKYDNFTIFVKDAIVSEIVEAKILKIEKNHAFAKIEKIIKKSENRVESKCCVSNKCGGCQLRHMNYEEQLRFKKNMIENILKKYVNQNIKVNDVIKTENEERYRNKAQFPVKEENEKLITGFFRDRTNEIIPVEDCIIQTKISNEIVKLTASICKTNDKIRHIITRVGFKTNEIMLIIVSNKEKLSNENEIIEILLKKFENLKTIILNTNKENTNVILGKETRVLYGNGYIEDYIGELKFKISPHSFFQVNPEGTEKLYNQVLKYANLKGTEIIYDLYCGIGTISLFVSKNAKKVYGIEVVEQAIKDAKENAIKNNAQNIEFYAGDVNKVLPKLVKNVDKPDVIIIDPPRKGCEETVLQTIINTKVEKIIYVSCNPETLARDLKILTQNGYQIKEIQPVDMFKHTKHVECVSVLHRKSLEK